MSEQGKQINLQDLYEAARAERDQYQQKFVEERRRRMAAETENASEIVNLKAEIAALKHEKEEAEKKRDDLKRKYRDTANALHRLGHEAFKKDAEIGALTHKNRVLSNKLNRLQDIKYDRDALLNDRDKLLEELDELVAERATLAARLAMVKREIEDVKETHRNDVGDLSAEIAALEQEVMRVRIAYRNAAKRAMARRRLLAYWQKDWKKKYEELKRLRTKLAAVREVYELAREHVPMGQRYGHDFGVVTDRLGQILGIRNVDPDVEGEEKCPAPSAAKDAGES